MASSRWKRFGFFSKNSLNVPSEVLSDLIPNECGSSSQLARGSRTPDSTIRQSQDAVSLVVSTASLPMKSKPANLPIASSVHDIAESSNEEANALSQMWSTLNACSVPELSATVAGGKEDGQATAEAEPTVLPSQSQNLNLAEEIVALSEEALDGLVLVFTASQNSKFVHCFDVTVRCNPPDTCENHEDLDGWRGYFAPFARSQSKSRQDPGNKNTNIDGIMSLATCRSKEGNGPLHLACISKNHISIWEDPHLILSCRMPLVTPWNPNEAKRCHLDWNTAKDGSPSSVDIVPGILAIGTDTGVVLLCTYGFDATKSNVGGSRNRVQRYLRIPPPPATGMSVVSLKVSPPCHARDGERKVSVFVAYRRTDSQTGSSIGICCYDVPAPGENFISLSAPSARHDLDGRQVAAASLCDAVSTPEGFFFTVARNDGLYTYSPVAKTGVAPIDGPKLSICMMPPHTRRSTAIGFSNGNVGSNYALVASTDIKSDRDVIDVYDSTNKLVAFHLLLSPGHRAVKAAGVSTLPLSRSSDGSLRGSKSSAVVLTSGGALISFTEKATEEKVSLLAQKNLFSAAVAVAYSDPSLEPSSITALYRKYAEHLYRKGDYSGSIEQYRHTIGSLESSHVIFRFLDAPKIPLLAKYLEELRGRYLVTPVHLELLRTCYLKLNDSAAAEAITAATSTYLDKDSLQSFSCRLCSNPRDALAIVCSLEAPQAAEMLVVHGAALARVMPRETAGVVAALCVGTYSPRTLARAATEAAAESNKLLEPRILDEKEKICDQYPVRLFYAAFIDNPKMLRLILAHCNRNKCHLTPSLRRTLLELTLEEWNQAKRSGDTELEKLRHREAIVALTDSHGHEIGDYDALVIVQTANFEEGELLLYERLQMGPMLLSRYAHDGGEKSRRQMLAMTQADPEMLADVLGHFVSIGSGQLYEHQTPSDFQDDESEDVALQILDEIQETLDIARLQGQVTPVRIARILAGEGTEQFSELGTGLQGEQTVPLSVALEYVGSTLDESRKEIKRLKSEVQEYNLVCNSMESEVLALMSESDPGGTFEGASESSHLNINGVHSKVRASITSADLNEDRSNSPRETFWRELSQSEDNFETVARFFARGVIR